LQVAFITAIPARIRSDTTALPMVEINFLCVHKKLRAKRLAPVLIKEITRRVNLENVWQAAYTAGVVLPKPIATCRCVPPRGSRRRSCLSVVCAHSSLLTLASPQPPISPSTVLANGPRNPQPTRALGRRYYHRSLNPKKLIEVGFSPLHKRMTMSRTIKLYKLPTEPATPGFRQMVPADADAVTTLLASKLNTYRLAPVLDAEEVRPVASLPPPPPHTHRRSRCLFLVLVRRTIVRVHGRAHTRNGLSVGRKVQCEPQLPHMLRHMQREDAST
jgi:glycylpeptide N-tetradecanoyltransferase